MQNHISSQCPICAMNTIHLKTGYCENCDHIQSFGKKVSLPTSKRSMHSRNWKIGANKQKRIFKDLNININLMLYFEN